MVFLVDCSSCCTPLHLPTGATRIRCAICHAFTLIAPYPYSHHVPASPIPFHSSSPAPSPSIYPPPACSPFTQMIPSPFMHMPPAPLPSTHTPPASSSFSHTQPAPSPFTHLPPATFPFPHTPVAPSPSIDMPPATSPFTHTLPAPYPLHHKPAHSSFSHTLSTPSPFSHTLSATSSFTHTLSTQSSFPHTPPAQDLSTHVPHAPSPYNHAPSGPPPPAHGQKRAVIVGVTYKNTTAELKGCINDANCMKFMLMKRFQFPESCILMLTEEETDPLRLPTKNNITMAMHWLIQSCKAGDSLVFHFSGHGCNQTDYDDDEVDGFDETLLPMDHLTSGVIVDDEINATIVRPLPYGVKLHAIVDACHSGTVLDLPYLCRMDRNQKYEWEDHRPQSGMWKGTSGGEVFSFTGCDDDQTSADTPQLSGSAWTGAMTYAFIQAIERGLGTTYGSLLNAMRSTVHEIFDKTKGRELVEVEGADLLTTLLGLLILGAAPPDAEINQAPQITQEPQLSATEVFDVYEKSFAL